MVSYLIREQFTTSPRTQSPEDSLPKRLEYTLYMLCLKEWNIDSLMYRYMWNPIKRIGSRLNFLTLERAFTFGIPVYLIWLYGV